MACIIISSHPSYVSFRYTSDLPQSPARGFSFLADAVTVIFLHHNLTNRMFEENLVRLGFSWSVSYIQVKSISPHEKSFAVGKSGPHATFNLFFSWVGLALGWGVRRFRNNIYTFSNPTEFGKSQNILFRSLEGAEAAPVRNHGMSAPPTAGQL